jgi:RHS repeat-associated protein
VAHLYYKSALAVGILCFAAGIARGASFDQCIISLDPSASGALSMSGSVNVNAANCGVVVDSSSSTALTISGSAKLTGKYIDVVGGFSRSGSSTLTPSPQTHSSSLPDPLTFLVPPTPGPCDHTNFTISGSGSSTLNPGVYCNGIAISGSSNVTFNAGTYILLGGGLRASGSSTLTGTGVTFFLTQNSSYSYGSLSASGSTKMTLSAPTAISSPYYGILFYQDPAIGTGKAASSINGSTNSKVEGVFYFPTTALSYSGSSQAGNYLIIVADTVTLTGSVNINGNFPNSRSPLEPPVSVTISPTAPTVYPARTQQFTAVINNSSQGVIWSLIPSTAGTISASGLYTAPTTVTSQQIVTVTATSQEDPTKSASAASTLSPPISVSVVPSALTLYGGQTYQLSATVNNASNKAVTWTANAGTINASGLYTAPSSITTPQTATITATSQADNSTTGTATVTLSPPISVSVTPTTVTLFGGQTKQFSATVNNASNKTVTWTMTPATGAGTISSSGLYTAPASIAAQQTVTITAKSQADNTTTGTATVTLSPPASTPLIPATVSLTASQTQQFTATLSNNTAVTWSINPAGVGTISPTGQYVAPSCISTQQTVTVTATGVNDPTQSGSAVVTLLVSSNVYAYNRAITINHTQVGSDQTNFPLLISGTYSYLATAANGGRLQNSNGYDIIFTDVSGATQLDHEIESYNPVTGQIVAWVRIPLLSSSTDTVINMWYGNSSVATSQANPTGVWNNVSYRGVYHLANGTTLSAADSTSNNYFGTLHDAAAVSGEIDGAAQFNGSDSYINIPAALFQFSPAFELWLKTSGTGVLVGETDGTTPNGTPAPDGWDALLYVDPTGHIRATGSSESPNPNGDLTGPIVNDNQWHLISYGYSFDNNLFTQVLNLYVDGQLAGAVPPAFNGGFRSATNFSYFLGTGYYASNSQPGSWNYLTGTIDEFRVFNNGLPIPPSLEYKNESSPATFYSISAESTAAPASLLVGPINSFLGPSQTQQFVVTNLGTCLATVNWTVNPQQGAGTISASGLYTAPATITSVQAVTVTAANPSNANVTGSANVQIDPTFVSVSPYQVTLYAGQTQQFTAAVTNANTAVTWSVDAPGPGSVNASGLYTAPAAITSEQFVAIRATSQADNTAIGSAVVVLLPPLSVGVAPTTAVVFAGQTQLFTASVANATNTAVTWSISPPGAGMIGGSGFYTAPSTLSSQQTVTVTATSVANPSVSATATITLTAGSFFTYSRGIVIDHTKVPNTDQTNFPVLISGTFSYLANVANGGKVQSPNGYDIVFTSDCNGFNKLNHEIESYNPATGQLVAWVSLPAVSHTANTVFYMWYGNNAITATLENPTKVWDSNYFTVLHLGKNSALSILDSTSHFNNGVNGFNFQNLLTGTPGLIGEAAAFNNSAMALNQQLNGYNQVTLSTWFNTTLVQSTSNRSFFGAAGFLLQLSPAGGGLSFLFSEFPTRYLVSGPTNFNDGQWHYAVGSFDGSFVNLYVDGQLNASTPAAPAPAFLNSGTVVLGDIYSVGYTGDLDEARISTAARSADWIATEYNNQISPSTFYTIYGENAAAFVASPVTGTLYASQTEQVVATFIGICSNPAVTFSLNPAGIGTLSSTGFYTAPASIATQQIVTLTASAQTTPVMTASATIILEPPVPVAPVSVTVAPRVLTLYGGNTQQFMAAVANTANTAVTWSIAPTGLGGISSTGLYTAPTTITAPQAITVTATSQADATKSATVTITLDPGLGVPVGNSPFGSVLSLVAQSLCRSPDTAPTVTVGNDQFTTLSSGTASVTVAGVVSNFLFDDPGQALTYAWSLASGPTGAGVQFATPSAASTQATFTLAGTYTLQLTVSDGVVTTVAVTHVIVSPAVDTSNYLYINPTASGPNATNTTVLLQVVSQFCPRCQVPITITGANPSTATVTLGSNSVGRFVYTGQNPGTDTVVATNNGLVSNAVTVTWIAVPSLITSSPVTGKFFTADGSGVFNTPVTQQPLFAQVFPNIDFNPATGTVPGNTSTVSNTTRPFTNIVTGSNGSFLGTLPAQGNDYQAGTGALYNFSAVFTGSFNVPAAGSVTFTFSADDAFVFGIGNGATRVSGPQINTPVNSTFQNYPVMGGVNQRTAPASNSITVNFSAAGVYPYEVDYAKGGDSKLTLTMYSGGAAIPAATLLTLSPAVSPAAPAGQSQSFVVSATTGAGVALTNLPVTLNITGVNPQTQQLTTDGTGKITFAYAGSLFFPGADQIQATAAPNDVPVYSNVVTMTWNKGINQAPVVSAGTPQTIVLPNPAILNGSVSDDGLPNNTLTIAWSQVSGVTFDNPNQAATAARFSAPGNYVLQLTASDGVLMTSSTVAITVEANTNLPSGWILNPVNQSTVSGQVPVTLIPGITLTSGTLTYYPANNPANVATINSTTGSGQIATFDSTLLANGGYFILLNGTNSQGQTLTSQVYVTVAGDYKPGRVTATITDLTVSAPGLPIQIQRTYDSLVRGTSSDFGFGWKLGINIQTSVSATGDVTLTLNGGTRTFYFTPPANSVFTFLHTPQYTPEAGLYGSLVSTGDNCSGLLAHVGLTWQCAINFGLQYQATGYQYTDPSGRVYTIDASGNLQAVQDLNGNTVSITPSGITSTSGLSVPFVRDASGRITQITDTAGNIYQYSYDANGNLASVKYPGIVTAAQYQYDPTHLLTQETDRNGHMAGTSVYYPDGKLKSVTDAVGNLTQYAYDTTTNKTTVTNPDGGTVVTVADAYGMPLSVTDPLGRTTTYTYDANHNVLTQTDPLTKTTSYTYDANGFRTSTKDPLGNIARTTYNALGGPLTITDPLNQTRTVAYDSVFRPTTVTDSLGQLAAVGYDNFGNATSLTDANGKVSHLVYDANSNVISTTDPLSRTATATYDALGHRLTMKDPRGNTMQYTYDALGRLTQTLNPDLSTETAQYDGNGNVTLRRDVLNRTTTYTFDNADRLTQTTYPDGTSTSTTSYTWRGQPLTQSDQLGRITVYQYDLAGQLLSVTRASGTPDASTTSYSYDADGRKLSETDPRGNTTTFIYDDAGRLTQVTNALIQSTTYAYDAASRRTSVTDALTRQTQFSYDVRNRLTTTKYPDGTTAQSSYDGVGRVTTSTDQASQATTYSYDDSGQLLSVMDVLHEITSYTYDPNGNRLTKRDANLHTTTYTYDTMNRVNTRILPAGGPLANVTYNPTGAISTTTDFNGKTTRYSYDTIDRLTTTTPDASLSQPAITFSYTATGRRLSMANGAGTASYTYDNLDRLKTKTAPQGTLSYTYDAASNLTSMQSSNTNGVSVNYTYDVLNRLKTVVDNRLTGAQQTTTYGYDAVGNLTTTAYPNGVQAVATPDNMNRLTNLAINGGSPLASYSYTYGAVGNKLTAAESSGRSTVFNYDSVYRLLQETISGAAGSHNGVLGYAVDPVGNRTALNSTLPGIPSATQVYDADDRLTGDTYDANGNTLTSGGKSFAYDFLNRLTGVNAGAVTFAYDGDGNRVSKGSTQYLVDEVNPTGLAQVVEEITGSAVQRSYAYGLQRISQDRVVSGSIVPSFYSYDGHGDVRMLTDSTGTVTDTYDYDSYGNVVNSTGSTTNVYLYQGEQFDSETGFYYLRARYFNPATGRFLSEDPAMDAEDNPTSAHPYLYAGADPVDQNDPSGTAFGSIMALQLVTRLASVFVPSASFSNNFGSGRFNGTAWLVACIFSFNGSDLRSALGLFSSGDCTRNVALAQAQGGGAGGGGGGGGGGGQGGSGGQGGPGSKGCQVDLLASSISGINAFARIITLGITGVVHSFYDLTCENGSHRIVEGSYSGTNPITDPGNLEALVTTNQAGAPRQGALATSGAFSVNYQSPAFQQTVVSANAPDSCQKKDCVLNAASNFPQGVRYKYRTGPNSNSFVRWISDRCHLGVRRQPRGAFGWNTRINGE